MSLLLAKDKHDAHKFENCQALNKQDGIAANTKFFKRLLDKKNALTFYFTDSSPNTARFTATMVSCGKMFVC